MWRVVLGCARERGRSIQSALPSEMVTPLSRSPMTAMRWLAATNAQRGHFGNVPEAVVVGPRLLMPPLVLGDAGFVRLEDVVKSPMHIGSQAAYRGRE